MSYVYHGSKTSGIKVLEPHKSTHGKYVYATKDISIAIVMSKCCGDDAIYSLEPGKDGKWDLIERIPGAFDKMFKGEFSLYTLDSDYFMDIHTGFDEVVSENDVPVLNEEHYDNLYSAIDKLERDEIINVYRFPNRPDYIPRDDMDFIYMIKNKYIKQLHMEMTAREISRWIFLHPNLENELRQIGKDCNLDIPNFEEIKEMFIKSQELNPNKEYFIDCAAKIYNYYNSTKKFESPILETDRLILKPGSLEDYIKVYEYDMTKLRDINGEFEFVKQDPEQVKKNAYPEDKNSLFDWILYLKEIGEPIGNIFAESHNDSDNSNEIGYNLHPNYWGNEYMKEATIAVLDYLFSLGYDKIYCGYSEGNVKSKRTMEKIGFKLDSINENAWIKDGIPITDYRFVMTKEMYDELYGSKKVR